MRDVHRGRPPGTPAGSPAGPAPGPVQVLCGPVLCRLRVWSEAEWDALPGADRPAHSEHVPGLGWVGAVPVLCLN